MAFPPVLAYRSTIGGSQAVVTFGGGTPKVLGDDVLGSVEGAASDAGFSWNRVTWFQGSLYASNTTGIYRLDSSGGTDSGTWTEVFNYTANPDDLNSRIGPLEVWPNQDGRQLLYLYYLETGSNTYRVVYSENGTDWSQGFASATLGGTSATLWPCGVNYQNHHWTRASLAEGIRTLNTWTHNFGRLFENEMSTPGGGTITYWANNQRFGSFVVSNEILYLVDLRTNSTSSIIYLWEYKGTGFESVLAVSSSVYQLGATANSQRNSVIFPDPVTDGVFYFCANGEYSGTTQGNVCIKFDVTGTEPTAIDVGDDIFTTAIRNDTNDGWWSTFTDDITDPMNPTVYFAYIQSSSIGNNWSYFRFVDDTTEAVLEASIPYGYEMPYGNLSDGFRINQLDSNFEDVGSADFVGERIIASDGSLQFSFEVFGGGTGLTANLYWGLRGEIPTNLATLTGIPTGGSISRTGNDLLNVAGDGTTYTAFWNFDTDGFAQADDVNLKLVVG